MPTNCYALHDLYGRKLSIFLYFLQRFSHFSSVKWILLPRFCKKNVLCLVIQSCPTLCNPMDYSPSSSSVHGDSPGKNTGVGPPPWHFPNPDIESRSPALQVDSLPAEPPGKPSKKNRATKIGLGTSPLIQWLRLQALSAGGLGSIPGWGKRYHMLQLRASMAK